MFVYYKCLINHNILYDVPSGSTENRLKEGGGVKLEAGTPSRDVFVNFSS